MKLGTSRRGQNTHALRPNRYDPTGSVWSSLCPTGPNGLRSPADRIWEGDASEVRCAQCRKELAKSTPDPTT
jgi:hypothetical protein